MGALGESTLAKKLANITNYIRYRIYKIIVVNILRMSKLKIAAESPSNLHFFILA
jgi:hypothetical protein